MWKIVAVWLAVTCMATHGAEVQELPRIGVDLKGLMRGAIVSLGAIIAAVLTGYFSLRLFVWAVIDPGILSGFMFHGSAKSQAEDSAAKSRGFRDHADEMKAYGQYNRLVEKGEYSLQEWDDFKRGWQSSDK